MNLAWRDIQFNRFKFVLAICGVGAMVCATVGMIGLYRGLVYEALILILDGETDLWVVQANTYGPITEKSQISGTLDRRIEGVPGVKTVHRFIHYNRQFLVNKRRMGIAVTGLDYPEDNGGWLPLITGRHLSKGHYEAVADVSTGFVLGERIRLGLDDYLVVGITHGQVDVAGDGMLFITVDDAVTIDQFAPSEAIILGHLKRNPNEEVRPLRGYSAMRVSLYPGADLGKVRAVIEGWGDVRVFDQAEQVDVMVNGRMRKLRIQILGFVIAMLIITGVVVSLAVYNAVLEKIHSIALLKLMGADDRVIVWMIVQNSLLIGAFGALSGIVLSYLVFPWFPRSVVMLPADLALLVAALLLVCACASWLGVARALKVRAQEVLA